MRNRRMVYGNAFYQRTPKTLALTVMCIAVLAAWQPWTGAATEVERNVAASPEPVGVWDGPFCWPFGATHQAHLPPSGGSETGRVLMFPAQGTPDDSIKAMLWNPKAGCFEDFAEMCVGGDNEGDPCTVDDQCDEGTCESECFTDVSNEDTNLFCAGHTAFADGTILTAGGHKQSVDGNDVGLADTNHFIRDPFTGEWGVWKEFEGGLPEMVEPRWYPTVTTLPDGRALVVSGSDSRCVDGPKDGEQCREASDNALDSCDVCTINACQGGDAKGDQPCEDNSDCDEGMCKPVTCDEDGDCVAGGTCDTDGKCESFIIKTPEIYDPAADPPGWTQLADVADEVDVPFYPLNFVLPDGTVLYAGAEAKGGGSPSISETKTYVLDLDADPVTWKQVPGSGDSSIPGGSAVMLEPGRVLKSGGGASVAGAAIFDWTVGTWTDVTDMKRARRRHQLTLLPNGTVLATGGTRSENREYSSSCMGGTDAGDECSSVPPLEPNCAGNADEGCSGEGAVCMPGVQRWVAAAEIYDPVADKWTLMARASHPRMYHSSALLLPDGRVVSAGGGPGGFGGAINSYPTMEIFSPPYYFQERPEITSAPSEICYGETFRITSPNAADVSGVTLLRLGTTTHSFDSDQRFQKLDIAGQGANQLDVVAPENANYAPPGYYMLFVLIQDEDEKGVPSVGEYVQVVDCCIPTITIPGSVNFDDTCVGEESTATLDVCNTGCANLEVTSIISSDPRFSATEPSSGFPVVISPDFCFPFQVTFAPLATGPQSAVLAVSSNDPTAPTVQVQAAGNGTEPDIDTLIADNGDFGDVCLGDFKDLDLTIVNSGQCPLTVSNITSDSTEFEAPGVMSFPLVIGPKKSLAVPIRFEPTGPFGPRSATITVSTNDPDTGDKEVNVSGNVPPGDIRVTGSTDFGQVCAEDLDLAEKTVSVCNVGACNLNVSDVSIVDCPDGDFTLINNPFPAPVSPDSCLDVVVAFTPSSCGPKTCRLRIRSDDPDSDEVNRTLTGHTPCASIDVPPDVCFPPTVIQAVDACGSEEPFPVSNTGGCNLTITNFEITLDPEEYSLTGLPSFPIILQKGHVAGAGDLGIVFAPVVLEPDPLRREHLGEVSVTYVSDPTTGDEMTVPRDLCGESVRTGARVLVVHNGVPVDVVKSIRLLRINANRNRTRLDTVDVARNLPLQTVTPSADCACPEFMFHREYGTVDNPIQLLPGSYEVSVMVRIDRRMHRKNVGFRVGTCGFNPNIVVDF